MVFGAILDREDEDYSVLNYEVDGTEMRISVQTGDYDCYLTEEDVLQLVDAFRVEREKIEAEGYYVP